MHIWAALNGPQGVIKTDKDMNLGGLLLEIIQKNWRGEAGVNIMTLY